MFKCISGPRAWSCMALLLCGSSLACAKSPEGLLIGFDSSVTFRVELTADSSVGEASIREHSIVWHPVRRKYYLVADVVRLGSPHHPNTYETELHLWSSADLADWTHHGVAVHQGTKDGAYDRHGVASPVGMVYHRGKLFVPFSARRTSRYTNRGIGLAASGTDPEKLPWAKTSTAISDITNSEDDDAALLVVPGKDVLHLYHRRTGKGGYRIVHTTSATPLDVDSWRPAVDATRRPADVRAQELTGAVYHGGRFHLFIIEHTFSKGVKIAHLSATKPAGPFKPANPEFRYLRSTSQPSGLAYSGHITPVLREGRLVAWFWTAHQSGKRYGLLGHPVGEGAVR